MDKPEDKDLKNTSGIYKEVGPYLGIGFQLAATVAVMVFLGRWIDQKFGKGSLFTLIFAFLGVGIGLYNFIKTVIDFSKKSGK
ncbi:MAG: AtpZ/AtpI family protein [Ignavibacteriaceae bacterium]|nr:AtpZ/AtpI family protein [Ignavibacteriaceae bacterium]